MNGTVAETSQVVEVRELTVAYGATVVLDRIDLQVSTGTAWALVGENGAGKSTLLRCIAGLQEPTEGTVTVFGGTPGRGVAFWRDVATTVESPSWYHGLTVREHLDLIRMANGADPGDGRIDEVCELLGVCGLEDSLPMTLSSGQRQRFLLTAMFVRPSRLLVLDEPEQRLDATVKAAVATYLHGYVKSGGTLVMASHDEAFWTGVGASAVTLTRPRART